MAFKRKSTLIAAATLAALLIMSATVMAQGWGGLSGSYGVGGQGWNAGYWSGSNLVPGDYTKNGVAWGSVGAGDTGAGVGVGYGGAGIGLKLPGQGPIKLGW